MATQLDLEEQEQLDQIKAFWKQYGNLITWLLIAVLGSFAAWNGWNWWQREQAASAAGMYDEIERAAQASDAAAVGRVFDDLKSRYPRTTYAHQAGLLAARVQYEKGNAEAARNALGWVAESAGDDEYRMLARLRLAGLLFDAGQHDAALKQLDGEVSPEFAALFADRRGDILAAQNKPAEASAAFQAAYKGLDASLAYRRIIEAKLMALGAAPEGVQ